MNRTATTLLFSLLFALFALPASAVEVSIQEWPVPWPQSRPRDPFVAPDGSIWFVGQGADYAARFEPANETFKRFDLPAGAGPHNLIVAADGIVWYAGNRAAHIGRLDPASGEIQQYPTPVPSLKDPHTLVFGPHGDIWFTAQGANHIGHFTLADGQVEALAVPTPNARPYGISLDSTGRPWIVLFGTNKLATIDPVTKSLREIALPRDKARPRRIAITGDDRIWYGDYQEGYLGVYDPTNGTFKEWRNPGVDKSGPYAMTVDDRGRIWFVETWQNPNRLVGFDPASEAFIGQTAIPSGAGAVRHMVFDPKTRSIWFGTDTNNLGRAVLVD